MTTADEIAAAGPEAQKLLAGLKWFDNHCHLTTIKTEAVEIVEAAEAAGVVRLLTVGCDLADSRNAVAIAARFDGVQATAGVHPHDAKEGVEGLEVLLSDPNVAAVGECGLDYHYDNSPRAVQREVFAKQIELAHRHDLPLVIHSRDAWDDTFAVLDDCGMPERTVFHCFSGGPAEAEMSLARGAYLSFSGIITFKNADELRAAAALTPSDRVLIETDSPFLTPVPHRGRSNQPAFVPHVGIEVARQQNISVEEIALLTWENGNDLYGE
jgi:TatD DNase family protein